MNNSTGDIYSDFPDLPESDKDTAMRYSGGDAELFYEMLASFAADTDKTIETIRETAASEEIERLRVAIHGVKSSSRFLGFLTLSGRMLAMEDACKRDDREYISGNLESLLSYYAGIKEMILPHVRKDSGDEVCISESDGLPAELIKIREALENFEMEKACSFSEDLDKYLNGDNAEKLKTLKDALESFDYVGAKEAVRIILVTK